MERREDAYAELETKAMQALQAVASGRILFRLWAYPTFENYFTWTVFTNVESENTLVRQVMWDKLADRVRFTNPLEGLKRGWHTDPTMTINDASLDFSEFNRRLNAGRKIRVSLLFVREAAIRLDGAHYGLEMPAYSDGIRLNWWSNGPEEWRELTSWAADMRMYLSQAFARE